MAFLFATRQFSEKLFADKILGGHYLNIKLLFEKPLF